MDKQQQKIKKRWAARPHSLEVLPAPGFTRETLAELNSILDLPIYREGKYNPIMQESKEGTIYIDQIDLRLIPDLLYRVACARHIYLKVFEGHVGSYKEFQSSLEKIKWKDILSPHCQIRVRADSINSKLYHEKLLKQKLDSYLKTLVPSCDLKPCLSTEKMSNLILIRIVQRRNRLSVWVSLNGQPMYRRGYRNLSADAAKVKAPLGEHFAAALFHWYDSIRRVLSVKASSNTLTYVPFAGSGTLAFEYLVWREKIMPSCGARIFSAETMPFFPKATGDFVKRELSKHLSLNDQKQDATEEKAPAVLALEYEEESFRSLSSNSKAFTDLNRHLFISLKKVIFLMKSPQKIINHFKCF